MSAKPLLFQPNPVVTEMAEAGNFWRAEEYHQRYLEKNGGGFCHV